MQNLELSPQNAALSAAFSRCFFASHNTELHFGASEPFYKAACENNPHIIYAREDFFQSALHEIAHWCVAGAERRKQNDYGYWYAPDGRSAAQQKEFYRVEVKPQAIEWLFSLACGVEFSVSADNLNGQRGDLTAFATAVEKQKEFYLKNGLPKRAALFCRELSRIFTRKEAHAS